MALGLFLKIIGRLWEERFFFVASGPLSRLWVEGPALGGDGGWLQVLISTLAFFFSTFSRVFIQAWTNSRSRRCTNTWLPQLQFLIPGWILGWKLWRKSELTDGAFPSVLGLLLQTDGGSLISGFFFRRRFGIEERRNEKLLEFKFVEIVLWRDSYVLF